MNHFAPILVQTLEQHVLWGLHDLPVWACAIAFVCAAWKLHLIERNTRRK